MESHHPDILELRSIYIALARIENYTLHLDNTKFQKDLRTVDAVIRCLLIIGSTSEKISKPFKKKHDSIPWNDFVKCGKIAQFQESQVWNLIKHESVGLLKYLNLINHRLLEFGYKTAAHDCLDLTFSLSGLTRLANGEDEDSIIIQSMIEDINIKESIKLTAKDIDVKNLYEVFSNHDKALKTIQDEKNSHIQRILLTDKDNEKRAFFYFSDLVLGIKLIAKKIKGETISEPRLMRHDERKSVDLITDFKYPIATKSSIWTIGMK